MKRGEQAKLIRELETEHGIKCSKMAISKLATAKDYRIHVTPGGKIKIPETVKALLDSDFGAHGKKVNETLNAKNGKPAPKTRIKAKSKKESASPEAPSGSETVDMQEYIVDGKLKMNAPRPVIERWKSMQSAEKDRIKNEKELKVLVNFDEVANKVFDFLRPLRDDIKDIAKRVSPIVFQAGSKLEAEKTINEEINRILLSRVGEEYNFDNDLKKKIIKILSR